MSDPNQLNEEIAGLREALDALAERLESSFIGQPGVVEELVIALLANGHVLLEGAPGLGKTTLVHQLSDAVELAFGRVQCTPDLIPSDVLGARILEEDPKTGTTTFRFEEGPIFTNVLLADEINRATPRTQSALLEAMQEAQVTLYGETRSLEAPFFVVATQNPIEMEGTYPLPEAQLDRFMFKILVDLPGKADIARILAQTTGVERAAEAPCLGKQDVLRLQQIVRQIGVASTLTETVARIVQLTHPASEGAPDDVTSFVRYGSSIRGGQSILLAAKARALIHGRMHATPKDVARVARPALRHRMLPSFEGEATETDMDSLVTSILHAAGISDG